MHNASGDSIVSSCWLRQTGGNSRFLLRLVLTTGLVREEVSQKGVRPTWRIQNRLDTRLDTQLVMKKTLFFRKRLDNPNGLVKDSSNEFMEQNETGTLLLAMPSDSAAGLLARVIKGVVSFLQNLLSLLTRKEVVHCGQEVFRLRALSQTTAVGTLYGLLFAGLLLMPFPIQSSVNPCSKIYQWNIHLFPITVDNTIPLNLCLEDHDEFIPAYHQIGADLSREIREIKIDWAECREDATVDAAVCLGECGLLSIPVGSKKVRDLIRKIIKNNAVPDAHLPPMTPRNPGKKLLYWMRFDLHRKMGTCPARMLDSA